MQESNQENQTKPKNLIKFKSQKERMVRCFLIADDYRWHVLTDDKEEFMKATLAYLELMNNSQKENKYTFKNIFLDEKEFEQIKKNMAYQKENSPKKRRPVVRHLSLID